MMELLKEHSDYNLGTLIGNSIAGAAAASWGRCVALDDYGLGLAISAAMTVVGFAMTNHYSFRAGQISERTSRDL